MAEETTEEQGTGQPETAEQTAGQEQTAPPPAEQQTAEADGQQPPAEQVASADGQQPPAANQPSAEQERAAQTYMDIMNKEGDPKYAGVTVIREGADPQVNYFKTEQEFRQYIAGLDTEGVTKLQVAQRQANGEVSAITATGPESVAQAVEHLKQDGKSIAELQTEEERKQDPFQQMLGSMGQLGGEMQILALVMVAMIAWAMKDGPEQGVAQNGPNPLPGAEQGGQQQDVASLELPDGVGDQAREAAQAARGGQMTEVDPVEQKTPDQVAADIDLSQIGRTGGRAG